MIDWLLSSDTYTTLLWCGLAYVVVIVIGALLVQAPYGRFASQQ